MSQAMVLKKSGLCAYIYFICFLVHYTTGHLGASAVLRLFAQNPRRHNLSRPDRLDKHLDPTKLRRDPKSGSESSGTESLEAVSSIDEHDSFAPIKASAAHLRWSLDDAVLPMFRPPMTPRPGSPSLSHACSYVTEVPDTVRSDFNLQDFYQQYTHAYNIPVLGSDRVSVEALQRACYTLRFMLADNPAVRQAFYKARGYVMIIATDEITTEVPEYSHLNNEWNSRSRGLGGTPYLPLSSGAEENVLCSPVDFYDRLDDIFMHELAHGVHLIGANVAIDRFVERVQAAFENARRSGLWSNTYAATNSLEYFAEGVQSYFGANTHEEVPNGVHNHVSNRRALRRYDRELFEIIREVFPCSNRYIQRCDKNREGEINQVLRMNCQLAREDMEGVEAATEAMVPGTEPIPRESIRADALPANVTREPSSCADADYRCVHWESTGGCGSGLMRMYCRRTCGFCR